MRRLATSLSIVAGSLLVSLLAGCANLESVFRNQTMLSGSQPGNANVVTIDAKQRSIVSTLRADPQKPDAVIARVCAEPPPDVMSTINSSLSAALSGGVSPTDKSAALNVAQAMVEQAAEIQRSQTMNLLALSMYRTCERYMNGAITEDVAADQALRDQHTMVTVLAIEQLTNLGHNNSTGATIGNGQASATAGAGGAIDVLAKAKASADTTAGAYATAAKALSDDLGGAADCSALAADKQAGCQKDQAAADDAKTARDRAETYYQAQLKLASAAGGAASSGGGSVTASQRGGATTYSDAQVRTLADTVYKLAELGVHEDPLAMVCARLIRSNTVTSGNLQEVRDACQDVAAAGDSGTKTGTGAVPGEGQKLWAPVTPTGSEPRLYVQVATADQAPSVTAINAAVDKAMPEVSLRPYQVVGPDSVPDKSDIRYFNATDAAAAARLSKLIGGAFGGTGPACKLRNSKSPKPGLLELWLAYGEKLNLGALAAEGKAGPGCVEK